MLASAAVASALIGCGPAWPSRLFPAEAAIERTLFARSQFAIRESCDAMVAELTGSAADRFDRLGAPHPVPPPGWSATPMPEAERVHASFEGAFGGCNTDGRRPLGDLPGALRRPGAFYKLVNGGEAIVIIVPRAKLAAYFNVG